MFAVSNIVAIVRAALVVLFVGVSLLIMAAGLLRRSRFNHIRMSWGMGRFFGLPLGPTLFLAGILCLLAYSVATGERVLSIGWLAATAYVVGGLCWYLGALLSGATIVTDWGVSSKLGRRHVQLAWHEVTDYVVTRHRRRNRYVFFHVDTRGYKQRLDVFVPLGVCERFQSVVEFKLDNRFDRSIQRPMGQQALEQ
ncbi:MAG: hypothetical protein WBW88_07085 [Rhodothermales bacterium]|jgi:hypothetical protein